MLCGLTCTCVSDSGFVSPRFSVIVKSISSIKIIDSLKKINYLDSVGKGDVKAIQKTSILES